MAKNKSSKNPPPPVKILRQIKGTNIFAPDKVPRKNEIIADIEGVLEEDILNQVRDTLHPYLLFIGNDDKSVLAACYAHCKRNIDLTDKIEDFRQSEEKKYKLRQEKRKMVESIVNPSFPIRKNSCKLKTDIPKRSLDDITKVEINKGTSRLTRFVPINCFGKYPDFRGMYFENSIEFKEDIEKWLQLFRSGHTVFLRRLKLGDFKESKLFVNKLMDARADKQDDSHGLIIVSTDSRSNLPVYLIKEFETMETGSGKVVVPVKEKSKINLQGESTTQSKTEKTIKLKLVRNEKKVYWDDNLLPTIKDINFNILLELAKKPGKPVKNNKLHKYIKSSSHRGVLLNQRMTIIRSAFPPPYNDIKDPQCIIPDANRKRGYRCLNLAKDQVKVV